MLPFVLLTAPRPRYRQDKDWELSVVGVLPICGSGAGGEAPADQKPHRKYASVMVPSDTSERWPVRSADVTVVFDERSAPRKFARRRPSLVRADRRMVENSGFPPKGGIFNHSGEAYRLSRPNLSRPGITQRREGERLET